MRRAWVPTIVLLAVLPAACGGGSEPAAQPTTPKTSPTPTVSVGDGIATPEALRRFVCREQDDQWSATGSVHNASKTPRTFQVTVQVGPQSDSVAARRITLEDVRPGATAPFEIPKIPTSSDGGPCHVQVLAVE